jgi:hypothetical protein
MPISMRCLTLDTPVRSVRVGLLPAALVAVFCLATASRVSAAEQGSSAVAAHARLLIRT